MSATPVLEVLIIGAGFGGIGMGIRLRQEGVDDFLILERGDDIGGVWRDNTYPGAACDVPSVLYSFSFAPNPNWSCVYPPQPEIHAYLHDCAERFELNSRVRTGATVADAAWEELPGCWRVTLEDGTVYRSRLLLSAVGQLSKPVIPRLEGAADFKGLSFHSAAWPAALSLAGKRVAVIGSGASAVQFVPAIAPQTARLTVFQRSANYLLPRHQRAYTELEKWLHAHLPPYRALVRLKTYLSHEVLALGFGRLNGLFSAVASKPAKAWPISDTLPEVGWSRPPSTCSKVLLPEPEEPTMASVSPALTDRLTSVNTVTSNAPSWKRRLRCWAVRIGVVIVIPPYS
jgi:cation diffusion facilitator CzcD-associated flavoprotein CzcO